ncbi:MAG TPA: outer membrane beta-barrel protein [Candidatus Aquilonibacter sp.]|nr:outer membrane beta-barrel protein [Candidatus Aquilonibacter sp.]
MSGKQVMTAVLGVTLSLLGASARAQDQQNEITGILGRTFISDQGIMGPNAPTVNPFVRSGKGLTFEINYSRYLIFHQVFALSGEVPAVFNLDEDLNSGGPVVPIDYKQIFVTPAVRVNLFPATAVSPWVSLGGGFGHFSQNSQLIYQAGANPGKSTTSGVLEAGVGLDVKFWHSFSIRGEFRDFWSGEPDFPLADTGKTRQHNYLVGGGVVWHF